MKPSGRACAFAENLKQTGTVPLETGQAWHSEEIIIYGVITIDKAHASAHEILLTAVQRTAALATFIRYFAAVF